MSEAGEIITFFKTMKTKDILWLLIVCKLDNVAEWVQVKAKAMQEWGSSK
jgi:hypothetical protein